MRIFNEFQNKIIEAYRYTNKNLVVEAAPGSGKTTILLELLKFVNPIRKVIFLAFNKSIVNELKDRVPINIKCNTLHSLGYKCLIRHYKEKLILNENKTFILIKKKLKDKISTWQEIPSSKINGYLFIIQDLYNIYRLTDSNTAEDLLECAIKYNIDYEDDVHISRAFECFIELDLYNKKDNIGKERMIDFIDMIYLPNLLKNKIETTIEKFDEVFIDEGQDLSIIQQKLIDLILKKQGRFIMVGDKNQCIYSFLGSDIYSFQNYQNKPNTITLPLSITYRCAKNIVKEANNIFNNIIAFENNIEGEIIEGSFLDAQVNDFILCRNNLPLLQLYLQLIIKEKPCIIKGKDLGKSLLNLILKIENSEEKPKQALLDIVLKLEEQLKQKGVQSIQFHPKYIELKEKIQILNLLIDSFGNLSKVKQVLDNIFSDDIKDKIILSTIHKAKGLEADNVYLLQLELIPSKYATQSWELIQEKNLYYVMLTRAKKKIVIINDF